MTTPQFLITSFITTTGSDLEVLRKKLYEKGVLSKDYMEDGLMLLYHKFDAPVTSNLERECRSLVIDRETLKIVSYSCETPRINKEGMEYIIAHPTEPTIINTCYEGTYLSVFNHNGKWYVSTRRCLNSQESVFNPEDKQEPKSHFDMFEEVLKSAGFVNFSDFTDKLNKTYSYYFVLIHHQNKHTIDYTSQFGENYSRICLTTIRDSEMRELDIYSNQAEYVPFIGDSSKIFIAEKLDSFDQFTEMNKTIKYDETPTTEGVVIRVWDSSTNKYHLIKLQTFSYQFSQVMGHERNIFKGLVYLYQNDKLVDYFSQNPHTQSIRKIVNPLNTTESYDTIGVVDSMFKVCTSELFELFKVLWSLKTGKHQNTELYEILPKEYKDIMFGIRGIYYKKKAQLSQKSQETVTITDIKNAHLKINDIYNYLKTLTTETFLAFLRMRKLMFNWVKSDHSNKSLNEFGKISYQCDKIHMKLCAIFTNRLYPNIMPNDIPPANPIVITV